MKKTIFTLMAFVLTWMISFPGISKTADSQIKINAKTEKSPLRFSGDVVMGVNINGKGLNLLVEVHDAAGNPVPGIKVMLEGNPAKEPAPGEYGGENPLFTPKAGGQVKVTFQLSTDNPRIDADIRQALLTAVAPIPELIRLADPTNDGVLPIDPTKELPVTWSGGTAPYTLQVRKYSATGFNEQPVFELKDVGTDRAVIPARIFRRGEEYAIAVWGKISPFTFEHRIDPESDFVLLSVGSLMIRFLE